MRLGILKVKPANKKAQALILAYAFIVFSAVLLTPLFQKIFQEYSILNTKKLQREAFYYAEGGIEYGINYFINQIANFNFNPTNPNAIILTPPVCNYVGGASASVSIMDSGILPSTIIDPDGISVIVKPYIFTATCQHPTNTNITVTVKQIVIIRLTSAFQYAVFYNDDLEILPGKPMTFNGRVFSNKDIYLGSDGSTVTINSEYLHTAGNIYNARKDGGSGVNGTVKIKVTGSPGSYVDMHNPPAPYPKPLDSTDANWLSDSQNAWKGTVKTSENGVTKQAVPVVGSISPGGYYNSNAGIIVTNGAITYKGTPLTQGSNPKKADLPLGTITTSGDTFYNAREGAYIKMTTIDLGKLSGAAGGYTGYKNYLSLNTTGLLYATVNNAGTQEPGVRLVNGSQIYNSSGLTVVTNDPLYIQGDYNTVNKTSSAVISDSVNILSNNWQDNKSGEYLSGRTATQTTVNTAFIAGVDTTTSGEYNGGLENYPRLLENWSSVNLNIAGSFIELWNTQVAHGAWDTSGVYNPPNRVWSYDSDLASRLPPFTPWAVEARKVAQWKS